MSGWGNPIFHIHYIPLMKVLIVGCVFEKGVLLYFKKWCKGRLLVNLKKIFYYLVPIDYNQDLVKLNSTSTVTFLEGETCWFSTYISVYCDIVCKNLLLLQGHCKIFTSVVILLKKTFYWKGVQLKLTRSWVRIILNNTGSKNVSKLFVTQAGVN